MWIRKLILMISLIVFIGAGTDVSAAKPKYYKRPAASKNTKYNKNKYSNRKKTTNTKSKSNKSDNNKPKEITITLTDELIKQLNLEREQHISDSIRGVLEKQLRKELTQTIGDSIENIYKGKEKVKIINNYIKEQPDSTTNEDKFGKSILHENILQVDLSYQRINDEYLSPLVYRGLNIGLGNEWWQSIRKKKNFGHLGKIYVNAGSYYNYRYTNNILALGVRGGWGFYSDYKRKNLQLKVGPYLEADCFVKNIGRNVNKPVSVDFGADLNVMLSIGAAFEAKKTSYRLRYTAFINLLGAQFMPQYWESYYELEKNWSKDIRFSHLGNRINLKHELTFDIQFPHSTWRVGARHEYLNYGSNNVAIKKESFSVVVATIFHYKINGKVELKK